MENKLRMEVEYLSNKNRFIEEMISDKLNFKNLKKAEIETLLKSKKYKTKTEIDSIMSATSESESPYDYLLNMNFLSLSEEKCSDLKSKTQTKQNELKELLRKTPEDLWIEDLDDFVEAYKETEKQELSDMFSEYQRV